MALAPEPGPFTHWPAALPQDGQLEGAGAGAAILRQSNAHLNPQPNSGAVGSP